MYKSLFSIVAIVAVLGVASLAPAVASAQTNTESTQQTSIEPITVPVKTIVRGSAGSEHELAAITVPNGEYKVQVVSENQGSVHPDSNISVRSNGSEVTVEDVESKSFVEKTAEGTLNVTDGKVAVYLTMGPDKVFSGGVKVVLTPVPPKEEPKQTEVCDPETGETTTVDEDKVKNYLPVGDEACEEKPEEPEKPTVGKGGGGDEPPAELPRAGIGAAVGGAMGVGAVGMGIHSWLNSRRELLKSLLK